MKILMFCRFYSPHIGGVEKHIEKVSKILLKKGLELTLITEKFEENLPDEENISGIKIYRVKLFEKFKWFNKFKIWFWFFNKLYLIKEADVIHCHDIFFWYLPFRFLFPQKPVYITFHGWEGKFPVPKRYILARKIWEKLAWGNICVGDYLKKWYGTKPTFVTYGGVDIKKCTSVKSSKFPIRIAFVGRLEIEKGIQIFFNLLRMLKKKKLNLIAEFYGNGKLKKAAENFGKVYGEVFNISNIVSNTRIVFTLGYLSSLSLLHSKMLVTTAYSNNLEKDIFVDSPFFKKILIGDSIEDLSKKICFILNHPEEEKKIVEKGYRWAKTQTWEKVANLYLKLWKVKIPEVST